MSAVARAAGVLLTALLTGAAAGPAAATQQPAEPERADLAVTSLSAMLTPEGTLTVDALVSNPAAEPRQGLELVATIHAPVTSRFTYQRAVDDGRAGPVRQRLEVTVEPVPGGERRAVRLSAPVDTLGLQAPGVYPLRLEVRDGADVQDSVVTSVIRLPDEVERPVRAALLLPLDAPPAALSQSPDDDLKQVVEALLAHPETPVTVATSGRLLVEARERRAGWLEALGSVVGRRGVAQLALWYGPADVVALHRHDHRALAAALRQRGVRASEQLTSGAVDDTVAWPPDGLDEPSLTALTEDGVRRVVLSERYLDLSAGRSLPWTPSPVRPLVTSQGAPPVTALVPDPWLEPVLAAPRLADGVAVATQRLLAETAVVYFERPNASARRGLLLAPPQRWTPDPDLLRAMLAGLGDAPWLQPVTVPALAATVDPAEEPLGVAYPDRSRRRELPGDYLDDLAQARGTLSRLATVLDDTELRRRLDRQLAAAAAVHYRSPVRQASGRALVAEVAAHLAQVEAAISVVEGPPVALTAAEGQVPLTLHNAGDRPLRVRVAVRAALYRFTEPERELVLPPGATTLTFEAHARAPGGTYPVEVLVTDPSGALPLASGLLVLRSTAYSTAALVVTVGAGVFLVLWWLRDLRRRRTVRTAPATPQEAPREPAQVGDR